MSINRYAYARGYAEANVDRRLDKQAARITELEEKVSALRADAAYHKLLDELRKGK